MLQDVIDKLPKEEAAYHMRRCVDSGLWVTDAKAAGKGEREKEKMGVGGGVPAGSKKCIPNRTCISLVNAELGIKAS